MYNNIKITMIYILWMYASFFNNINQNIFENNLHISDTSWFIKLYTYVWI